MKLMWMDNFGRGCGAGSGRAGKGFTLVEVLLAIFILSIGLIMVASVFPVGADWTRQNAEDTMGAVVARNAQAIIMTKLTATDVSGVSGSTLVALPGIGGNGSRFPLTERAYGFGMNQAYPALDSKWISAPGKALYYWTALIRQSPTPGTGPTSRYDLYIFVFKKGDGDQTFKTPGTGTEIGGTRDNVTNEPGVPFLVKDSQGNFGKSGGMQVGMVGVGETSGTVFRLGVGPTARPGMQGSENAIFAPPADGTVVSPLVYVYQTTVSF